MTARTLVLLRHAKAETPGETLDFERRLTERGVADAAAAGAWLAAQGFVPHLVLCSPATRTRQTWQAVTVGLGQAVPAGPPETRFEAGLYDGGRTELIDLLRLLPEDTGTVLVVGHNPTMSDVSILLRPYHNQAGATELKTCGIAVHRDGGLWADTEPGAMALIATHTARG